MTRFKKECKLVGVKFNRYFTQRLYLSVLNDMRTVSRTEKRIAFLNEIKRRKHEMISEGAWTTQEIIEYVDDINWI